MLFYDWKKIYETCKGNTAEIVRVLKMLVEKQMPVNHYDKIYKYYHIDFRGSSFLLHPDVYCTMLISIRTRTSVFM